MYLQSFGASKVTQLLEFRLPDDTIFGDILKMRGGQFEVDFKKSDVDFEKSEVDFAGGAAREERPL